ncbi:MAG: PH domain-containing protein [Oscillospiraceae bacterium]|nr:PH domain-containing protein [Oscillospiraceae bacterium]
MSKLPSNTIWSDRKRTFFGLPWTFTKYILTDDKMLVIKGFLNQKEEEIRLYRVMDLSLKRSLFQMFFGIGTITMKSADQTEKMLAIKNIRNSREVKELLSTQVEKQRVARGVTVREEITNPMDARTNRAKEVQEQITDRYVSKGYAKSILFAILGVLALIAGLLFVKMPEAGADAAWLKTAGHYALLIVGGLLILFGIWSLLSTLATRSKADKR